MNKTQSAVLNMFIGMLIGAFVMGFGWQAFVVFVLTFIILLALVGDFDGKTT